MKVAVLQFRATNDKQRNIAKAIALVDAAAERKAKFILLPEMFNFRGSLTKEDRREDVLEKIPGVSIQPFMDLAKKKNVYILAGSVCEKIEKSDKAYNTSVLINNRGKIAAKYRKIHLFDARVSGKNIEESKQFLPGKKRCIAKVEKFVIGLSVCYDLRFPLMYSCYAQMGANILCVPSAFTSTTGKAHWEVLLRARAVENVSYVLAANQIGKDERGVECYGNSMIVDPWGEILARASSKKEEILVANIEKAVLKKRRAILRNKEKE